MMSKKRSGALSPLQIIILILLPLVLGFFALCIGRVSVSPLEVFSSIAAKLGANVSLSSQAERVLWTMRLPRILLAALVGAGLSVAGCSFQSLFSNPLATPDTLGVASGASFGAALGIFFGFSLIGIQLAALGFGIAAVLLTFLAGSGRGRGVNSYVLSGIMIGSLFTALVSLVKYTADTESQLPSIVYWLMGSLNGKGWQTLLIGAPPIIASLIVLFLLRWRLNILPLSDDEAKSTGVNVNALRVVVVLCSTAMTASCVSMCGQVGWVGLLAPHICRMRYGDNHLSLIPASMSVGACFMIIVDTIARSVSAAEIPVSILTAIVGAPFFILLMRKTGGGRL